MPTRPSADPARFDEAVDAFRKRVPVTDDEWQELVEAEREWAFHVAHVTQASVVQDVFDALDSAILEGTTFADFQQAASTKLAQAWGAPNAPRIETVFRTNVMRAYNEGRQQILESKPVKDARPYLRFDAVGDNRTSDICNERDGIVRPADDPWWTKNRPPLHHQCRSVLVPLTKDEAEGEDGFKRTPPSTPAAEGFGAPATNSEDFEVDFDRFSPPLRNALEKRLGKKRAA